MTTEFEIVIRKPKGYLGNCNNQQKIIIVLDDTNTENDVANKIKELFKSNVVERSIYG